MDCVSDALFNGKRIRALTVVDKFTCKGLAVRDREWLDDRSYD